jgi:hypothetical protein
MDALDLKELETAVRLLENPSWIAKITGLLGVPLEWAVKILPKRANRIVSRAVTKAITLGLKTAVLTMSKRKQPASRWRHRLAVTLSGAGGGFFGLLGLAVELPISTAIILRSIADIARSEGEDIKTVDTQCSCVMVFALGGNRPLDDSLESGYYAVRIALAKAFGEAVEFIAKKGIVEEGAPVLVRFIAKIASRFEVVVSEKVAADLVPIVGAASGAAINLLFMNHFQSMAQGHFIVRKLERKYGEGPVREKYQSILEKQRRG